MNAAVDQLADRSLDALRAGSPTLLAEFVDEQLVFRSPGSGEIRGRDAVIAHLTGLLAELPMSTSFEWSFTDGVSAAMWLWVHLPDPDGSDIGYEFPALVLADRSGERWDRIQVFLNPVEAQYAVTDWQEAGGTAELPADPSLVATVPSHPVPPSPEPFDAIVEAVCDALLTENWLDLIETTGADWHDHGGFGIGRWADGERRERWRATAGSRAVMVIEHERDSVVAALVAHVNDAGRVTYLDHVYDPAQLGDDEALPAG
ncbi:MAG: nuclear transport factor 2 family protein [Ilumatobacteraceae bacterium]